VEALGPVDYVIFEGFKTLDTLPRIIVPRSETEVAELSNGLEVAVADIDLGLKEAGVPVVRLADAPRLADIAESRGFLLAGMNCRGCGYETCKLMAEKVLSGAADASKCVWYSSRTSIRVNGVEVPLNPFAQKMTREVILGLLRSLRETGDPRHVEVEFDARSK